jgi:predicted kinase
MDSTFLEAPRREEARALASEAGAPFQGSWLQSDAARLRARLASRRDDASDADETVLRAQLTLDPGAIDWPRLDAGVDIEALLSMIGARLIGSGDPCSD